MRRLTIAQSEPLEAEARSMLRLYRRRLDNCDVKTAKSLMPIVEDMLRRGHLAGGSGDANSLRLSAMERWLVNVTWALKTVGELSSYVMLARLTRSSRMTSTWDRIAQDLEAEGFVLLKDEVAELYRLAVPLFIKTLRDRKIGRDLEEPDPLDLTKSIDIPTAMLAPNVTVSHFISILRAA